MHVPGHDGDSLGVDAAEVGVFEQTHQVGFGSLLKSTDRRGLELQTSVEILGNLPHQPLDRGPLDEQLGGLLVPPDLPDLPETSGGSWLTTFSWESSCLRLVPGDRSLVTIMDP